jgi:hypothetical protein
LDTKTVYQSAERYWLFQSIEAALFLAVSVVLVSLSVWIIKVRAA